MKHLAIKIIAFVLTCCMLFLSLTACKGADTLTDDPAAGPAAGAETPDLDLLNRRDEVLTPLENDFLSRNEIVYEDINGGDVTVYTMYREPGEVMNNPNFAQAVLFWQAIRYKDRHPEEDVKITVTSFHYSIYLAACLDESSADYGRMKNLFDCDYDGEGYYRLAYLLIEAARRGIEVTVVGHIDAFATAQENGVLCEDMHFEEYFEPLLKTEAYISGKTVGDYMTFRKSYWTSYGDKSATDMMHVKSCSVSHYTDNSGVDHGPAVWVGSINLDGINYSGANSHDSIQTAVVLSGHEEIWRVVYNYTRLLTAYCAQEEINLFRNMVMLKTTRQIALLSAGKRAEIPDDELIVYIGSEEDAVFEFYFAPFGGAANTWDTVNNPYCKYLSRLLAAASGGEWIELVWNNVKYVQSFELADIFAELIVEAFRINTSTESNLHLQLPGIDTSLFAGLTEGENIGELSVNEYALAYHIKDTLLSYCESGERQYVSMVSSLNFHSGSMSYQTNQLLIIKETEATGNRFYIDYAIMTTPGIEWESRRLG